MQMPLFFWKFYKFNLTIINNVSYENFLDLNILIQIIKIASDSDRSMYIVWSFNIYFGYSHSYLDTIIIIFISLPDVNRKTLEDCRITDLKTVVSRTFSHAHAEFTFNSNFDRAHTVTHESETQNEEGFVS